MESKNKCWYFVSDAHFGIPDYEKSKQREKLFVNWLEVISKDATDIFIVGDLFDFWFEWKHVVPKGYIRLFGKLAELSEKGLQFHFFYGNHDMWMKDYFVKEFNARVYDKYVILREGSKTIFVGHGDGLGKGDYGYKFIKTIFRNKLSQKLYSLLHPDCATDIALFFSRKSRKANTKKHQSNIKITQKLVNYQLSFATEFLKQQHIDYFIFGHQHRPNKIQVADNSFLYNIGNWETDFTFIKFYEGKIEHLTFRNNSVENCLY